MFATPRFIEMSLRQPPLLDNIRRLRSHLLLLNICYIVSPLHATGHTAIAAYVYARHYAGHSCRLELSCRHCHCRVAAAFANIRRASHAARHYRLLAASQVISHEGIYATHADTLPPRHTTPQQEGTHADSHATDRYRDSH